MYQPLVLPYFRRQLEPHASKYRHLKDAVAIALDDFRKEQHAHVGHNVYKVRLRSKDIPRGKSKSFRMLVLVRETEGYVVPMTLYFKGDRDDITKKEVNRHLENILLELQFTSL
ncbi:MAG: hypothetical protein A3D64_02205 [Candidatus Wildermuthbacteria bacterium RIFCSPHIGHO2_02_FULL_49_9]|uniref:Addiction module toxin RelE n=2 Tax=Candidatus Wildermuthiibacteriota TaxID=1817923 RepID=A0A1G2QYJ7_9BACT|nr:MAG: hypothetical protein A2672_01790 [Candidatus Wildermuthbacteria bacterium RIFCSPHIGHO2_01_FULL_49_22b]OHA70393.1 MAG: hypothetical protein A3D64_02205 [Candidatus Wildermuthbacteria bacterium RIFCSPHIGHO2_02_FULL_49_9]